MANDQQQSGNEPQQLPPPVPPAMPKHGATRRRLAKAGLGAAGVLWTLESHATLSKTGFVCESPSAYESAGLNSNIATEQRCRPLSPTMWCFIQSGWPCNKTKRFAEVFSCNERRFATTYYRDSLLAVMKASYDRDKIGCHLAAAYLNVISDRVPVLDVPTLKRMWSELKVSGHFKVDANTYWSVTEVRNYLVSIHGR
ncbi:MAG: hypothetical protein RR983_14110 [Massilia sp.]|uniref:hypothetical protein n=1 Tax=Massilia sp. TaxID=1882437 RepID=UPI0019BF012E|nr:hypothetical protein [Oxalobacteraceae sp. CFBP 8755]